MALNNKVAIVTGGAQGIGNAFASALLKVGMKVCICDIKDNSISKFIESLPVGQRDHVLFQKCDVSSYSDYKKAFEKVVSQYGRIDVVVNNAGIMDESSWQKMVDVNFIGVINGIQLAFQYMDINKGGNGGFVINTGSCTGFEDYEIMPVYSASKHGVHGLTKNYGTEYHFKRSGIKVNAVCPGAVETQMLRTLPEHCIDEEAAMKDRRLWNTITPEEVAKALIKILEDGKNGALLRVDEKGMRYA